MPMVRPEPPPPPPWPKPGDAQGALGGADLSARLDRWAADARVDEAAQRRSRERWLRQQAEEGATMAGVLADLAEGAAAVTVQTAAGHRHQGVLRAVGADFVAVETGAGAVLVAMPAVVAVRTRPGAGPALGVRPAVGERLLADVLAGMAADRERVALVPVHGGDPVTGALVSVGRDVAGMRSAGERVATAYVPLGSIGEVLLPG
ncbi:MAG TPA: hypothetical protein VFZ68_01490 [Acidimicrobiales bacterium]